MKQQVTNKILKEIGTHILYMGIAYDEPKRHEHRKENHIHPLFDWQITEKQALSTCYKHGFTWGGCMKILTGFHVGAVRYKVLKA